MLKSILGVISLLNWFLKLKRCIATNECLSNPCSANAECQNTPESFTCTCKDGFNGTGIVCKGSLNCFMVF